MQQSVSPADLFIVNHNLLVLKREHVKIVGVELDEGQLYCVRTTALSSGI
jgi:hypothetical protein